MWGKKKKVSVKHWGWFAICPRCNGEHCFMSEHDDNVYCADCNYPLVITEPKVFDEQPYEHRERLLYSYAKMVEYKQMMKEIVRRAYPR